MRTMKKKSNFLKYTVYFVIFAAVACYLGINWYRSTADPFRTEQAVSYTMEDSVHASGIVIRDEALLCSDYSIVDVEAQEGERVSIGKPVAYAYGSEEQLSRSAEIRSLEQRIEQIESVMLGGGSTERASDSDVLEDIYVLRSAVGSGDLSSLTRQLSELKTVVFSHEYSASSTAATHELSQLRSKLAELKNGSGSDSVPIYAECTGMYSSLTDGQEALSSDILDTLDAEGVHRLVEQEGAVPTNACGKLINGFRWYYAAVLSEEDARILNADENDSVRLRFTRDLGGIIRMTVHSVGQASGGECMVVFSSIDDLEDIAGLRDQEAEIILNTYSGLRVSKDALRLTEDNEPCVYIVYGPEAKLIKVELLYEGSDYYILKAADGSPLLAEGSEVIVSCKDLHDGKVIG